MRNRAPKPNQIIRVDQKIAAYFVSKVAYAQNIKQFKQRQGKRGLTFCSSEYGAPATWT